MNRSHWIAGIAFASLVLGQSLVAPALAGGDSGSVIDRFQAAYRAGSIQGMLDLYAPDATFEDVNQRHHFQGTEQLRAMLGGIVAMHLRLGLEEQRRVVDHDTVVVEYAYTGQLNGAALGSSVGKEGCPDLEYALPTTSWFKVANGRIVHQKDFIDWATFLELRHQMLSAGTDVGSDANP